MELAWSLAYIAAVALVVNIPLGYLRTTVRKFSLAWFLCIHASIPLVAFLRADFAVGLRFVPLLVAFALCGQFLGGRLRGLGSRHPRP